MANETGTVKHFNAAKGFGFITPDNGGKDLFVHHSGIDMDGYRVLEEGQRVSFSSHQTDKGMQADDVRLVD